MIYILNNSACLTRFLLKCCILKPVNPIEFLRNARKMKSFFSFEYVSDHGSILSTTFLINLPLKYLKIRKMDAYEIEKQKIKLSQGSEDAQCLRLCYFQAQIKPSLHQNILPRVLRAPATDLLRNTAGS